ncbi:peptidyl-tRNA hydrolase [mine drainage metagenome]|uniref:peptidyl-tRNA hydrolase n=1 Tax=mine drainage metagenome TaxID=410659 RepID=T0ZVJ6_9ZZZZ
MPIRLIVGLGNPGAAYEDTRHNAGVWGIEALARQWRLDWRRESRFQGRMAKVENPFSSWLLCPETFMNLSGRSVAALANFYRIEVPEILVLHDELDLPPGVARLKQGGGSGGHNGLKDLIIQLGSPDFWRLRIGIGHPGQRQPVADYVLHRPSREEQAAIEQALERGLSVLPLVMSGQFHPAMNELHKPLPPP